VQGNCDDRGSREYNLALGQRRADSVRRAMVLLGVKEKQIETVSFGAEKPVAFGQDEEKLGEEPPQRHRLPEGTAVSIAVGSRGRAGFPARFPYLF